MEQASTEPFDPDKVNLELGLADRITLEVSDLSNQSDEALEEMIGDFSFALETVSPAVLRVAIRFAHPAVFSRDGARQALSVRLRFSDFEPGWVDEQPVTTLRIGSQMARSADAK